MQPVNSWTPLGRSIGRTHKMVRAWGDRELAALDSSVTEWIVLFHIGSAPAPGASQTQIARYSEMGGPALVRHIDRLESEGIVTRTRDTTDRRIIRLSLTEAGHERLEALRQVMARCDETMRAVLDDDEADVLQGALDKVFAFALAELHAGDPSAFPSDPPPGFATSPLAPITRSTS
ncbi:MAG TPA: MarR family winged helix-turn-helix transcriptional regulator [Iamia sp.]|jgi:DNA-binding MarR family transcriptional regulator|nr:MarR family winged helix-turn-helix transcriptional regulator [Iamia sp.]